MAQTIRPNIQRNYIYFRPFSCTGSVNLCGIRVEFYKYSEVKKQLCSILCYRSLAIPLLERELYMMSNFLIFIYERDLSLSFLTVIVVRVQCCPLSVCSFFRLIFSFCRFY